MSAPDISGSRSTLTPDQAATILRGDENNLIKKVAAGKPLSASERKHLIAIQSGSGVEQTFVSNATDLADALNVDRRTITNWKRKKGAPKTRPDGRYNVTEWRAFKATQRSGERDGETGNAKDEQVRLQNEKLAAQVEILRKEWIRVEDVEAQVGQIVVAAKRVLLGLPSALAPQVVGSSLSDAERLIREGINDALAQLHYDPAGNPSAGVEIEADEQ